jgi:hypothetical protein
VVLFPGGFGTLDEAMETLTLVQTGKHVPFPLVLVDEPGGTYWSHWFDFLEKELLGPGYVSPTDFSIFERVDSVAEAVAIINRFYYRYHSMRYVGKRLVIRLTAPLAESDVADLKARFSDILSPPGEFFLGGPTSEEADEPAIAHLPRLILDFNRKEFGRLGGLINAINLC